MIVPIQSIDDLKKVLFIQKTVSHQARAEMLSLACDGLLPSEATQNQLLECAEEFMEREKRLLTKYANYPSLSEFSARPELTNASKWGATFGVTLLVGELIIEQVKHLHPEFGTVMRQLLILLLSELEHPQHDYLVEPLEKAIHLKLTNPDGTEIPEEKRAQQIRSIMKKLVESIAIVGTGYGIIETEEEGLSITPLGKRVLLHLMDASEFVEDMTKAHANFQSAKPKLSMMG